MNSRMQKTHILVPATSANLGPGFDCMALALDLWNEVVLEPDPDAGSVSVEGEGAKILPKDGKNRIAQAAAEVFGKAGLTETNFSIACTNRIPVSSGMGSSAAAAVGGLIAANASIGNPFSRQTLIQISQSFEANADNTIAAFVGGLVVLSSEDNRIFWRRYELPSLQVSVLIPDYKLSTGESRSFLPEKIDHRDAVVNLGRALLTVDALRNADYRLLAEVMQDRLHQPYRLAQLPGVEEILQAAKQAGAAAAVLSGAGPGVIAFAESGLSEIQDAMLGAAKEKGIAARGFLLHVSNSGAYEKEPS
jgi:homoserine kinase